MDPDDGGSPEPAEDVPPRPDFPVFGLATWDGPRILERWSASRGLTMQLALGHGLRLVPDHGWWEVATFRPPPTAAGPGTRLDQASVPLDRIRMELDDLRTYGLRGGPAEPGPATRSRARLVVGRAGYDVEAVGVAGVCCADLRLPSDSLLRVSWYGSPDQELPPLGEVTDLDPYLDGARRDGARRRDLFAGVTR